jgi:uncharacterized protein
MPMLVGRDAEMRELGRAWERARTAEPQLVVIWCRRRIGKTYLLTRFADRERAVYFTATRQDSEQRQVERYAQAVREQLGEDVADLMGGGFSDWEAALRFTVRMAAGTDPCSSCSTRCRDCWPDGRTSPTCSPPCGRDDQRALAYSLR